MELGKVIHDLKHKSLDLYEKPIANKLWYLATLQAASLSERSKRDASDETDSSSEENDSSESDSDGSDSSSSSSDSSSDESESSSEESDSSVMESDSGARVSDSGTRVSDSGTTESDSGTTESDSTTTESDSTTTESDSDTTDGIDDCSLLGDYIDFELSVVPTPPGGIRTAPSSVYILVLNETLPILIALLQSTPSLFANFFQIIAGASGGVGGTVRRQLAADFVSIANDSCGIALSPGQTDTVNVLFVDALASFLAISGDCDELNQTIVTEIVAAVDDSSNPLALVLELAANGALSLQFRVAILINSVLDSTPGNAAVAAAQTALDEFLFIVNDFCGIPPLSNTTLSQLNDYYLVDVVSAATGPS